ncbi:hypothetical protein Cyrtocomes_00203 [Candidatus Cyrtobacter comes]|uniref:Uncharacterized protein n=1 Tax=Candidatus Cyrtobacter comes TaxID=675776 RepID=A0ABU5L7J8_9RICK|nr:hypothetical protein [Candidatus Cyrtobacter comes]
MSKAESINLLGLDGTKISKILDFVFNLIGSILKKRQIPIYRIYDLRG